MAMADEQVKFEEWAKTITGVSFVISQNGHYQSNGEWLYQDDRTQLFWECWQTGVRCGRKSTQHEEE